MWPVFDKTKDKIYVVAPANGKYAKDLIESSKEKFTALGYTLDIPNDLFDEVTLFHSNNHNYIIGHLSRLIASSEVKVIWCYAGGYGSAKLIEDLAKLPQPENEKIFIGFSDITALHLVFNQKWGWNTIHGATLAQISMPDEVNPQNINQVLGLIEEGVVPGVINLNKLSDSIIDAPIVGELVVGNLAIIQTSIGTDWQIETDNKIVILEDVNEAGYRVERMLFHLKQAGVFDNAKAIILGDFTKSDEADGGNLVNYALNNFIQAIAIPAFKTNMIGHGYNNTPIVEGAQGYIMPTDHGFDFYYNFHDSIQKDEL